MYSAASLTSTVADIVTGATSATDRDQETLRALSSPLQRLPSMVESWASEAQAGLGVDEETATVVVQARPSTPYPVALTPQPCGRNLPF